MVYEWYDSTRTLKTAVILYGVTLLIFITAFFTPYWLQSHADENLPNPKFTNLGKKKKKSFLIVDYRLLIGLIFFRQVQLGHAVLSTIGT